MYRAGNSGSMDASPSFGIHSRRLGVPRTRCSGGRQSDCGFRITSRSFQRSSARHEGFVLALYTSVWQKTVSRAMAFRTLKSFFPTVDELLQQDLPTLGEVSTHAPEKL